MKENDFAQEVPIVKLVNDLKIAGRYPCFYLLYKDSIVQADCTNYTYISNVMVIVKSFGTIYIYSTKIKNYRPKLMARMFINADNVYIKVTVDGKMYIIDQNCQVSFSDANKMS